MMADIKRKVPNLRFKGFTDDWEQRKVLELADRYDNLRVPITASERVAGETPYYGANGIQDYVKGFTHNGEFVLVAEDGANDLQNYPVQYVDGKVWVNNHAHVLQAKEERVDNKFLTNALKHTNIEPYLVGGGRAKLNADVMMKINFKVPTLPEQVQIGKFFDNLDHLIALQQRKLDLLKQLKKGLLQKMFADKDSKQPVLRFNGFSGDWDEVKLSDNSKIFIGLVTSMTKHYAKNGTFLVRNSDISENFISHHKPIYLDSKFAEKNNNRRMRTNDVVTVHTGNIGTSAVISEKENGAIGFATIVTRPDRNVWNALFLSDYLNTSTHKKWAIRMATGDGRNNYNLRDFIRIRVPNPGIDEQKKVSKFVQLIENNISDQQQKIRNLETLKKSLLQQMFI